MTRAIVVLGLTNLSVPRKIEKANAIVQSMKDNANFPTPVPSLDTITGLITDLEGAQLAAFDAGTEETANMYAKADALERGLKTLAAYVESVANTKTASEAGAVVLSSGMTIKQRGTRTKPTFEVKATGKPGELNIRHKAVARAMYEFYSTTTPENESSWTLIEKGTRSRFVQSGLTSGTRYHFRVAVTTKDGQQPLSEVKSAIAM
jgi:hypothetical protein